MAGRVAPRRLVDIVSGEDALKGFWQRELVARGHNIQLNTENRTELAKRTSKESS